MFRLFKNVTPEPLKEGDVIEFVTEEPGGMFTENIRGGDKYIVKKCIIIPYTIGKIVPSSDYVILDFSNQSDNSLKLYPTTTDTFYEILIGFRGHKDFVIQASIPAGSFPLRLQETTMYPDLDDATKRWLGAFKPDESPSDAPKLRIHTLKDMEPLYFYAYNVGSSYEKLILDFAINKLLVEEIPAEQSERYPTTRYVYHYDVMKW